MRRDATTLGKYHHNVGIKKSTEEKKFVLDLKREFYSFDILPMPKPRMTQKDKWAKRDVVVQYFGFKDILRIQAKKMGFSIDNTIESVFFVPMPSSWSKKKKELMNGMPCKVRPDVDNLVKAFMDSLGNNNGQDDNVIWKDNSEKRWAYHGSILIYK